MALDNTTVSTIMAAIASAGLFLNAIVHWDRIRPVLTSRGAIEVAKLALIFGGAIGSALLAAMTGVFNFAVQFALAVNDK